MTHLSRHAIVVTASPAVGDATNGHVAANDGATFLNFTNAGASARTATVLIPDNVDGTQAVSPLSFAIPASATVGLTGIFPVSIYGPQLLIDVSHSDVRISAYSMLGP